MDRAKVLELQQTCERFLNGHRRRSARDWLTELAALPQAEKFPDVYGEGPVIADLEQQVASLLGKEAAVFMLKGVVAQLTALRVWTDSRGISSVVLHPKSHIDLDEESAYERLHNLRAIRLGEYNPITLKDLEKVKEAIGVVTLELPLRRAGYKLPTWEELNAISEWCRARQIPLHFDGARLWESAPYYGRSLAEICALADSVYVSFYKGLGGLSGCVLAGSTDFISKVSLWKSRHGGNLFTAFPYVLSAQVGLERHLPKMPEYWARAKELAATLAELPGVHVVPNPPQTNAFQLYLPGAREKLEAAVIRIAEEDKVFLFGYFPETAIPALSMVEITVGECTAALSNQEVFSIIEKLLHYAR